MALNNDLRCVQSLAEDIQNGCPILVSELQKFKVRRFAMDSISALKAHIEKYGQMNYEDALSKLFRTLQGLGITSLFIADQKQVSAIGESGISGKHFIADKIISMGNQPRGKSVHRYIEVVKSRGQHFFAGRHSLKILEGLGLRVFPRASIRTADFNPEDFQPTSEVRVSIGNSSLDEMLGGGVYLGKEI